jgi:Ca-activated chloride channel homolog
MRILRRVLSGLALLAALPVLSAGVWRTGAPLPGSDPARDPSGTDPRQQDQPAIPTSFNLKVNVDLVTIDALVRDKRGVAVGDLQSKNFLIYDNGVAQDITHFSRDQLPLAVALVIDRSPSISRFLPDLRSAGLNALKHLRQQDQVSLYSFDECPTRLTELTEDRDQVAAKIGGIKIGRSTNIYGALFESARFLRENAPDRRRTIILISDNYSSMLPMTEQDVITQMLEASATLFSIKTPGDNAMSSGNPGSIDRIARETGGEVLQQGNSEKLSVALYRAISNLRLGYTLGFVPAKSGEDRSLHSLSVKLSDAKTCPGCRIQARSGYYAGSNASLRPGILIGRNSPPYNCAAYFAESAAKQRLWLAAEAEVDFKQVNLQVLTETETDERGKSQIKLNLHIGPAGLGLRNIDGRYIGRLDIAVFYGDAKGRYLGEEWQTADLQLREDEYQQVLKSGVMTSIMIPFKTPGQIFKVGVCDVWSGRVGTRLMRMR